MERNLTSGSVLKTIMIFSPPFFLSYFLQTLYGMADLFIIGQFNGVESTTAVSIGSQVMHMLTVMIVGLAMGSTIMIGKAVGAQKKDELSSAIGNTITLFLVTSIITTVLLLFLVKPIVSIMSTPTEAVSETISYLIICFIGIPFITAYNIISSIFRGLGDSKSPMYFIAISCVVNIGLDYLFIGYFGLGAAGAALGTTIAQTISVVVALIYVKVKESGINISLRQLKPDFTVMKEILHVGVPICLQDGFIQISFIVITVIVNQRGLNDAAAVGIVEKIISFLFLVPSSMLATVSALGAQNIGAGKRERAKDVLKYALAIAIIYGSLVVVVMMLKAEFFIGLFSDSDVVARLGAQYMHGYVFDCIIAGIHFCFSGYFCACGKSIYSFMHNVISIVCGRVPLAYFASVNFPDTLLPMGIATSIGSSLSVIVCVILYIRFEKMESAVNYNNGENENES